MTLTRAQLLREPAIHQWQPGRIARLWAVAGSRQQAGQRLAARAAQPAPVVPAARGDEAPVAPRTARRAGSEARYVRRWLGPRLPDLCEAVLRSALGGDMEAARLLLRMGGLDGKAESARSKKATKTGPGFAKKAMDEFRSR